MEPDRKLPPVRRNGRLVISFDEESDGRASSVAVPPAGEQSLWAGGWDPAKVQAPATPPAPAWPPPAPAAPAPVPAPAWTPAPPPVQQTAPQWSAPASPVVAGEALWWARCGAVLVDGMLSTVVVFALSALAGAMATSAAGGGDSAALGGLITAILAYVAFNLLWVLFYAPLTMRRPGEHNGQTFGKQLLGIRVQRVDGAPVTAGTALLREFVAKGLVIGTLSSFLFFIPLLLDCLWPLWDNRGQALHDKLASTVVVRA